MAVTCLDDVFVGLISRSPIGPRASSGYGVQAQTQTKLATVSKTGRGIDVTRPNPHRSGNALPCGCFPSQWPRYVQWNLFRQCV